MYVVENEVLCHFAVNIFTYILFYFKVYKYMVIIGKLYINTVGTLFMESLIFLLNLLR